MGAGFVPSHGQHLVTHRRQQPISMGEAQPLVLSGTKLSSAYDHYSPSLQNPNHMMEEQCNMVPGATANIPQMPVQQQVVQPQPQPPPNYGHMMPQEYDMYSQEMTPRYFHPNNGPIYPQDGNAPATDTVQMMSCNMEHQRSQVSTQSFKENFFYSMLRLSKIKS